MFLWVRKERDFDRSKKRAIDTSEKKERRDIQKNFLGSMLSTNHVPAPMAEIPNTMTATEGNAEPASSISPFPKFLDFHVSEILGHPRRA